MSEYQERLEQIRQALRDECVSYGELVELADLVPYIAEGDVELLEAAGVPEFPERPERDAYSTEPSADNLHTTGEPLPTEGKVLQVYDVILPFGAVLVEGWTRDEALKRALAVGFEQIGAVQPFVGSTDGLPVITEAQVPLPRRQRRAAKAAPKAGVSEEYYRQMMSHTSSIVPQEEEAQQ